MAKIVKVCVQVAPMHVEVKIYSDDLTTDQELSYASKIARMQVAQMIQNNENVQVDFE